MNQKIIRRNKSISRVRVLFGVLFAAVSIYLAYFMLFSGSSLMINNYNPRLSLIEANTIRGTITDKNGEILAETIVDGEIKTRNYPFGPVFSHVVGFTDQGKSGIESTYDLLLLSNHQGIYTNFMNSITGTPSLGDELRLTLDAKLQQRAYELLDGRKGAIVAMEPSTGKILAMVSSPAFDPNTIAKDYEKILADEAAAILLNRASQGVYPPGSTFKILTTLAYIEEKGSLDFSYDCKGEIAVEERKIHCYNNTVHGEETLSEAFAYSCNTAFTIIGQEIDLNKMLSLADRFYFNQNLPFDLVNNMSTYMLTEDASDSDRAETLIGQGKTTMTPLHNAVVTSVVANAGLLMKPYVLDAIYNASGKGIKNYVPQQLDSLMTPTDARTITDYMEMTTEIGTAKGTYFDALRIASKTGSAENPHGNAHAWYVGFAPIEAPELVLSIIIENVGSSSQYAVPIARELYAAYFNVAF